MEIPRLVAAARADGIKIIKDFGYRDNNIRQAELVTSPFYYFGAAMPHPDTRSPQGLVDGFNGRMGSVLPVNTVQNYYTQLRGVTEAWLVSRDIQPISPEETFDFEEYIAARPIPLWRKQELRDINKDIIDMLERNDKSELMHFKVKLFCKDENYTDFKLPRGIYAREDVAKVFFGPYFNKMESIVYEQPEFIKHVPVKDRGKYVDEMLNSAGAKFIATDYSKFECHFDRDRMENCEFVLYQKLLGSNPRGVIALDIMREVLQGNNRIYCKWFTGTIAARRMSGEMNTSLGNGFSNLMMMTEVCTRVGNKIEDVLGVVEGDDGLFRFLDGMVVPTTESFRSAGCDIKLDTYERISDASFCGLLYDETDKMVITDPYDVLCSIGLLTKEYAGARRSKKLALLRCKALSTLYQYPSCPIISEMSRYILRFTKHIDIRNVVEKSRSICLWEREQYYAALKSHNYEAALEIGIATRLLFSELYGISVEAQLRIENDFKNKIKLEPFSDGLLDYNMSVHSMYNKWQLYFDVYKIELDKKNKIIIIIFIFQ